MIFRKSSDILITVVLTVIAALVVVSGIHNVIRVLLALPLMFVFPGYAVVAAMFSHKVFRLETYIVFGMALSISITALTGLILNFTSWGLQPRIWLLLLTEITLMASVIAIVRRHNSPWFTNIEVHPNFNWPQIVMFGLAVVLMVAAINVARQGVLTAPTEGFTQLWMLPPSSDAPGDVRLGVHNQEATNVTYHLVVHQGSTVLGEWDTIELAPGQDWQGSIKTGGQQDSSPIDAQLYRSDSPTAVYRSAALVLDNQSPNS